MIKSVPQLQRRCQRRCAGIVRTGIIRTGTPVPDAAADAWTVLRESVAHLSELDGGMAKEDRDLRAEFITG